MTAAVTPRRRTVWIAASGVLLLFAGAARVARTAPIALGYVVLATAPLIVAASIIEARRATWKSGVRTGVLIGLLEGTVGMLLWALLGPDSARQAYTASPGSVKIAWALSLAVYGAIVALLGAAFGAFLRRASP